MAHRFYFKIPNDQMQMIILFQWSNKLQYSFVSGLTQFNDPNHFDSLRNHRIKVGGERILLTVMRVILIPFSINKDG